MKKYILIIFTLCFFKVTFAVENNRQNQLDFNRSKAILVLINSYRAEQGLPQLKFNNVISDEAKIHSQEMAEREVPFGHEGFKNRARNLRQQLTRVGTVAENVVYADPDPGNEMLVKQWIMSAGHRKNIQGRYNLTGIGLSYDKHGGVFVTQIFLNAKSIN